MCASWAFSSLGCAHFRASTPIACSLHGNVSTNVSTLGAAHERGSIERQERQP